MIHHLITIGAIVGITVSEDPCVKAKHELEYYKIFTATITIYNLNKCDHDKWIDYNDLPSYVREKHEGVRSGWCRENVPINLRYSAVKLADSKWKSWDYANRIDTNKTTYEYVDSDRCNFEELTVIEGRFDVWTFEAKSPLSLVEIHLEKNYSIQLMDKQYICNKVIWVTDNPELYITVPHTRTNRNNSELYLHLFRESKQNYCSKQSNKPIEVAISNLSESLNVLSKKLNTSTYNCSNNFYSYNDKENSLQIIIFLLVSIILLWLFVKFICTLICNCLIFRKYSKINNCSDCFICASQNLTHYHLHRLQFPEYFDNKLDTQIMYSNGQIDSRMEENEIYKV